jgi:hypothetical protein
VKAVQAGELCLRMVEFTPDYRNDHWCSKGHVILVLSGSLTTMLKRKRAQRCSSLTDGLPFDCTQI